MRTPAPSPPPTGGGAAPELAEVQAAMVRAALRGTPLPGGATPLPLPDRGFLPASGAAPLHADNVAPGVEARLAGIASVVTGDGAAGAAYLHFQPPELDDDMLWLTLEVVLHDGEAAAHPLGGVQAVFVRTDAGWRLAGEPRAYAT